MGTAFDVIVIGGGPAGAATATLLAERGRSVLVLEQSRFPREKLCGEFIAPECLSVFERLGVRHEILAAGARPIRRMVLHAPDGRPIHVPMTLLSEQGDRAWGLSRATMDKILLDRARERGAAVREGFRVSSRLSRDHGLTCVEGKGEDQATERYEARLVINASGRSRLFAPPSARKARGGVYGRKVHLSGVEGLGETGELFFFKDGYGGICRIEGGRANLCFLTTAATLQSARGDRSRLLDLTMRSNAAARRRLENAVIDGRWVGTGPVTYGNQHRVPGVLAIGDAAGFIDPFTGSGIQLALTGGELAAEIVDQGLQTGIEVQRIIDSYGRIRRSRIDWRFRACSLLRRMVFQPSIGSLLAAALARHMSLARVVARAARPAAT
jgi:menaquinone-9 beta-reductase